MKLDRKASGKMYIWNKGWGRKQGWRNTDKSLYLGDFVLGEEGRVRAGKLLSQNQHVESMEGCTEGRGFNRTVPE